MGTNFKQGNEEVLEEIASGLRAGMSYSEIGAALGISKNTVAGLVHRRLRDVPRPTPRKAGETPSISAEDLESIRLSILAAEPIADVARRLGLTRAQVEGVIRRRFPHVRRPRSVVVRVVAPPPPPPPIECIVVSFAVASGCRWPLWSPDAALHEKSVCGATRDGVGAYCAGHANLAYRTPIARRAA